MDRVADRKKYGRVRERERVGGKGARGWNPTGRARFGPAGVSFVSL